jgi:predicted PurR-regulated permease PerM
MTSAQQVEDPVPDDGEDVRATAAHVVTVVTPGVIFRWAVAATLGVFVVTLASTALYAIRHVLVLVVIALFIAVSLDPAARWLIRRGVRRSIAVTIISLLLLLIVGGFIVSVVPPLVAQASKLVRDLPDFLNQLQQSGSYRSLDERFGITPRATTYLGDLANRLGGGALGLVSQVFAAIFNTLTVLVFSIYFMADLPRLRRGMVRLFPRAHRPRIAEITNVVVDKVGAYMIGNLIISVFAGVATFVAVFLLDVQFALALAFLVALMDLVPMVGATIGAVSCVAVALFTRNIPGAVGLIIFFIIYQQVENYLIAPRVLRNTVDLSSAAVLFTALIGGTMLGVVGALMAIPVAAAIKVLVTPAIRAMNEPAPVDASG